MHLSEGTDITPFDLVLMFIEDAKKDPNKALSHFIFLSSYTPNATRNELLNTIDKVRETLRHNYRPTAIKIRAAVVALATVLFILAWLAAIWVNNTTGAPYLIYFGVFMAYPFARMLNNVFDSRHDIPPDLQNHLNGLSEYIRCHFPE